MKNPSNAITPGAPEHIIRTFIQAAWDEASIASAESFLAANYVDHTYQPGTAEGLLTTIRRFSEAFSERETVIEDILTTGQRVMLRGRIAGRHVGTFLGIEPSQRQIDVRLMRWFRLDEGRIVEHMALLDVPALMQQLR